MAVDGRRERAWERLSAGEQARMRLLLAKPPPASGMPPFAAAASAYEKVLHALAAAQVPVSPPEIAYLLIARWGFNTDVASVRRRLALAVQQGEARSAGGDRYLPEAAGLEHLLTTERRWLQRGRPPRPKPQETGPSGPSGPRGSRRGPRQPGRRNDPA